MSIAKFAGASAALTFVPDSRDSHKRVMWSGLTRVEQCVGRVLPAAEQLKFDGPISTRVDFTVFLPARGNRGVKAEQCGRARRARLWLSNARSISYSVTKFWDPLRD